MFHINRHFFVSPKSIIFGKSRSSHKISAIFGSQISGIFWRLTRLYCNYRQFFVSTIRGRKTDFFAYKQPFWHISIVPHFNGFFLCRNYAAFLIKTRFFTRTISKFGTKFTQKSHKIKRFIRTRNLLWFSANSFKNVCLGNTFLGLCVIIGHTIMYNLWIKCHRK